MHLIDEFDDTINGAKSGLIGSQVKVDKAQAYAILDQMRSTIPEEIKQARWINKERHEMLEEAKRESARILEAAQEERDRLCDPDEIQKLAERRAEKILEDARATERQIRLGAEDFADGILGSLESNLERFTAAIQRGRDRLNVREQAAA
jgi:cell division septum initiation protein DivIVA